MRMIAFIGSAVGSWVGWWLGMHLGIFAALLIGSIGAGGGYYLARRYASGLE